MAGHQFADRLLGMGGEADVAVGEDADQLAGPFLDHREARNIVGFLDLQRVGEDRVGGNGQRVDDHPGFELLDLKDLGRLLFGGQVLMDDAHAAGLGHGDGEAAFGDRVHGRRQQRNAEIDGPRQAGRSVGVGGQDVGFGRHQEHIVEGKGFGEFHAASSLLDRPSWRAIIQTNAGLTSGNGGGGRLPGTRGVLQRPQRFGVGSHVPSGRRRYSTAAIPGCYFPICLLIPSRIRIDSPIFIMSPSR